MHFIGNNDVAVSCPGIRIAGQGLKVQAAAIIVLARYGMLHIIVKDSPAVSHSCFFVWIPNLSQVIEPIISSPLPASDITDNIYPRPTMPLQNS